MTLFEKVEAAQKLRRDAREPACAAQAMRRNSESSVKSVHEALAEYRFAFVEGNGLNGVPLSVKKKIAAASSSQPNLRMTPTPCRDRVAAGKHTRGTAQASRSLKSGSQ